MARFSPNRKWKETENNQIEHEFHSEKFLLAFFFYIAYNNYGDILFNQIVQI